ncbi:MAG: thioesterase [Treponema sp.]|nr:thioesterase [Treponema sp.]
MEKLSIWSENQEVRFRAVDTSDSMTLSAVFDFFQEAAISHAENLSVGRSDMARANQVWILSRMSVQIDRRPKYGEIITVRTWPRGGEKLFALRDYDIRDADGNAAVRARSCWVIIDREKRRPLRPQSVMSLMPLNEGLDSLSAAVGLEENTLLQKTAERRAMYTDMDYNGHVNNVSYIRWIEDALDSSLLENAQYMRLDINYLNEVLLNEVIGIWTAPVAPAAGESPHIHAFAIEGKKEQGEKAAQTAFRAELRLSKM